MSRSFKRLESVLKLESDQGYQDKAVVGGIAQFATYWVTQARQEAVDEADRAFVEQTAEVLANYARLPGKEARANTIGQLRDKLLVRAERVGQIAPPPRPNPAPHHQPGGRNPTIAPPPKPNRRVPLNPERNAAPRHPRRNPPPNRNR